MSDYQAEKAQSDLQGGDLQREAVLSHGTAPDEPEVQEGEVARLHYAALRILFDTQQLEAGQQTQDLRDDRAWLFLAVDLPVLAFFSVVITIVIVLSTTKSPAGDAGLQQAGAGVEVGQSVPRARHQLEELRDAVEEVEDLRNQEEHERLGEVAEDANGGEHHPREVAVRVAHEDARRVPVVS